MTAPEIFTAFAGHQQIAQGDLQQVAAVVRTTLAANEPRPVLVFSNLTGKQVDIDLRDTATVAAATRPAPKPEVPTTEPAPRRRGRPKLGVVGREVTLLPRHWDWLNRQPGSPSAVLRKLVEVARLASMDRDRMRMAREATYNFISAIAGDEPGFEEASRALFAGQRDKFAAEVQGWPEDVLGLVGTLAEGAFEETEDA